MILRQSPDVRARAQSSALDVNIVLPSSSSNEALPQTVERVVADVDGLWPV